MLAAKLIASKTAVAQSVPWSTFCGR
jgi:hypothetical protein